MGSLPFSAANINAVMPSWFAMSTLAPTCQKQKGDAMKCVDFYAIRQGANVNGQWVSQLLRHQFSQGLQRCYNNMNALNTPYNGDTQL